MFMCVPKALCCVKTEATRSYLGFDGETSADARNACVLKETLNRNENQIEEGENNPTSFQRRQADHILKLWRIWFGEIPQAIPDP